MYCSCNGRVWPDCSGAREPWSSMKGCTPQMREGLEETSRCWEEPAFLRRGGTLERGWEVLKASWGRNWGWTVTLYPWSNSKQLSKLVTPLAQSLHRLWELKRSQHMCNKVTLCPGQRHGAPVPLENPPTCLWIIATGGRAKTETEIMFMEDVGPELAGYLDTTTVHRVLEDRFKMGATQKHFPFSSPCLNSQEPVQRLSPTCRTCTLTVACPWDSGSHLQFLPYLACKVWSRCI